MITNMTDTVLAEIKLERERQERLKAEGRFKYTPDEVPLIRSHAMLVEEVGEVSRCILSISGYVQEDLDLNDCMKEIIQVAAIATAMAEGLLQQDYRRLIIPA